MGTGIQHKPVDLVLLGDVMLGRFIDDGLELEPETRSDDMFTDWPEFISQKTNAIVSANLECAITTEGEEADKLYAFKVKPKNSTCLKKLKLDVVSLANNHCLDYGAQGLAWTLKSLESMDIKWAGAGPDAASASKPAVVVRGGLRVAYVALSDMYEWWAARDKGAGLNYVDPLSPASVARAAAQVSAARQGPGAAQFVVVLCHWGPNWRWQPDADVRALARALADAGADVVVGSGPHHVQGVELAGPGGRTPVIYSAGKFMDDFKVDGEYRNDIGCVWVVRVEGGHAVSLQGVPCHIKQETRSGPPAPKPPGGGAPPYLTRVLRAGPTEGGWAARRIAALSRELGTQVAVEEGGCSVSLRLPPPPPPPPAAAPAESAPGADAQAAAPPPA
mmetsp:Transcript_22612/g.57518  ORF Transcript_22612/g.57518 Transcript_22612/m.57518 type:complete len:391 (-) Transcript_22612:103-1275(-)|eukprot:CAMPEP_0202860340 /NCGR_PEP_ID=MMETSP1391-20130828/2086_1 /ASSEMBLY_ACC=CAM_ASM_000867 /TAXON_ID=1034604 /ORGANISM="Chlamydomonas leiostraca, Strain SAG 11-49" /LENGTH=390 /DNA_ID=CAMNT_0049539495 /DNA_START=124 /DNA_END=1296 /DNA_ORIENTATION=-